MKKFAYRQYSIRELYDSYTRNEMQELKTIFEYLKTDFTKLCEDEKRKVMNYPISATVLFDFTDEEINNTIKILR